MKNMLIALLVIILMAKMTNAQDIPSFYEHYTGLISQELKITADLIKLEDSFSGFYYYQFKEADVWKSSKPIALDGQVNDERDFVLNEFGENHSFFQGKLENSKLIKGQWLNSDLKDKIEFTLKATYPKGSIPLRIVESFKSEYFHHDPKMPQARFHINVLYPTLSMDKVVYHQLLERIYYLIGFRGGLKSQNDIISALEDVYFNQFQMALSNIRVDSIPESFNWEKSIRMDVINNESSLLCLQVETYAKTGLQDGTRIKKYLVFNVEKNKVIKLSDLLIPGQEKELNELLDKKLRDVYNIKGDAPLSDFGFFNDTLVPTKNFYIHPGGIGFYYNLYEIAPAANGSTDLFIPWEQLEGVVNSL